MHSTPFNGSKISSILTFAINKKVIEAEISCLKAWSIWLNNSLFLTIITLDLIKIMYCFVQTILVPMIFLSMKLARLGYNNFSGQNKVFLLSLLLILLKVIFFFLFLSFCKKIQNCYNTTELLTLNLGHKFFQPWIFYSLSLGRKDVY